MRILHVSHEFPPYEFAGTAIYTFNIVKALSERHDVFVFARLEDKSVEPYKIIDEQRSTYRVRLLSRPSLEWNPLDRSYFDEESERLFLQYVDEVQPDIVHFQHLLGISHSIIARVKERGIGVIVTLHDFWMMCPMGQRMCYTDRSLCEEIVFEKCGPCVFGDNWSWTEPEAPEIEFEPTYSDFFQDRYRNTAGQFARKPMAVAHAAARTFFHTLGFRQELALPDEKRSEHPFAVRMRRMKGALSHADLVITPSAFLRDEFIRLFDVPPDRIIHSLNGMKFDHVVAHPRTDSDVLRFGFVGSIIPTKGVHVLVDAAKKLAGKKGFRVDIHGAPNRWTVEYEKELHESAEGHDHIVFHGRFDNKKIGQVLAGVDVLVVPSIWYENAPLTLNEAAMTKTPVIASDRGGMLEFVRDNRYGKTFELGNSDDLARLMEHLIDHPEEIPSLAENDVFIKPVADNAAELERYYTDVAAGRPAVL